MSRPLRRFVVSLPLLHIAVLAIAGLLGTSGCAAPQYRYGSAARYHTSDKLLCATETQIERGAPHPVIDAVGWIFGIPSKILMWNRRMENHRISSETEQTIAEYLEKNELHSVKVRLNQYAPGDDWKRLRANMAVGAGWRYSLGALSVLGETLLPGRLIGGDHYNPFTNTVHLYSDVPAVSLHEGAHAKDFAQRYYKGTYAAVYLLPTVPLWHEAVATGDAIGYLQAEKGPEDEADAYKVLYPAYGTYVGNAVGGFVPGGGTPMYLAGVLGGHLVGRYQAWKVKQERGEIAGANSPDASSQIHRDAARSRQDVTPAGYESGAATIAK